MRARKIGGIVGGVILALLVIVGAAIFVFTQTDWGRERVRQIALSQLRKSVHGIVDIGGVGGNLLSGPILANVRITDSTGAPFLQADSIYVHYDLGVLLHKRIDLHHVRLVNPIVVLDRKTGGKWNFDRIFPRDTTQPSSGPGFGSWLVLRNTTLVNGHITVHAPWAPESSLTQRQQDSVIRYNLGPEGRQNIVRVGSGFQRISDFRDVNGFFPFLQLADPNDPRQIIDASSVGMIAQPFRPPVVRVVSADGRFTILHDSLYFNGAKVRLPGSLAVASGRYNIVNNDLRLRLHADTVATNDLLWIDPDIPHGGTGSLDFALDWVGKNSDYQATNASLAVAGATLRGSLGVLVNDTLTFHDTDLRFANLNTRTIQQLFPTLVSPRQGKLTGHMIASGSLGRMRVNGDVAFDDPQTGRSRVIAQGGLGITPDAFRADNLKLRFLPFRVPLARAFVPTLDLDGNITGTATLNGSTASRLTAGGDLTHTAATGESRVVGDVAYEPGSTPLINADLLLSPLSLATVGQFVPAAGLRGTVSGPVKISGPLRDLVLSANLTTPDGGTITASGTADFAKQEQTYDLAVDAVLFNAREITTKSPPTSITADVAVRGRGLDPATMQASAVAHIKTSQYDSVGVDSATVRVAAANGMLTVDTMVVHMPSTKAVVTGQFGLTQDRSGTLQYAVALDSLNIISSLIPRDTGVVVPRPGILARRVARARADSTRIAQETAVERAVTGQPAPKLAVDTPRVVSKSALLGSVRADGSITGNIHAFNLRGTASGRHIVALGNSVDMLSARYAWDNALTPSSLMQADLLATNILASGFALDTIVMHGRYQQPNGTVNIAIHQDDQHDYVAAGSFMINQQEKDFILDSAKFRFDTTVYATTKASLIRFGDRGIDIDAFEMASPVANSRIYVDGFIPKQGSALVDIDVTRFNVANLMSLLQSDLRARGLISLDIKAEGTVSNPVLHGAVGAEQFSVNANPIPEIHGVVDYADQTLQAQFVASRSGGPSILVARGTVPVNLSLTEVKGSRVPKDRKIEATIVADSLPLDAIPEVTDLVSNLRGNGAANFTVGGTIAHPIVNGRLALRDGTVKIIPSGVTYTDVSGDIRVLGDTVVIDSLVAHNGGEIRLAGGIGIKTLTEPSFALGLTAHKARVLDNDNGQLDVSADLKMHGPFKSVTVDGTTRVENGYIYISEGEGKSLVGGDDPTLYSVLDTTVASNRELFPTPSPLLSNLRMNVAIAVNRDVFVRSQSANVEVYTDGDLQVSVDQTKKSLVVDGVLLSDRGEYDFQGRRFQIKHGSAVFTNMQELNPMLQITGVYQVQFPTRPAINIQILIGGTLNSPSISLSSDAQPPISQTDLLSYLAFGQSSSSLLQMAGNGLTTGGSGGSNIVGQGAAFAARQVAAAAVGALANEAAGEAARSLGADVFKISPAEVSLDAASFLRGTQIEFGKYIQTHTFFSLRVRPDPASLARPGFDLVHRFPGKGGYRLETNFSPRYLPIEPSLSSDQDAQTTSVFGLFFIREWRF
jgi:translocation and assembly module TamB